MADLSDLEHRLRRRGHRITKVRREILRYVIGCPGHFDAESLLAGLHGEGCLASRATVYRTLGYLVDAGILRRHEMGERQARYEPRVGKRHHEHLICVGCGRIIEFVDPQIERLQREACRRHGFRPLRHTLQIHGLCLDCLRSGEHPSFPSEKPPAASAPGA